MLLLHIQIPGLPKNTNSNQHGWQARRAEARKWKTLVMNSVVLAKYNHPPLDKAKLTLIRHSSQSSGDFDGLVSSFKHVIDGLIDAKVLVNDRMSNIGAPEYRWCRAPRNKGFIEVIVEAA